MAPINSFKDLTVWQVSMDLADVCFDIVEAIPHPYRFTFANQLIPAGISIPSNIAEGSRLPPRPTLTICPIRWVHMERSRHSSSSSDGENWYRIHF
jgi:hypothetical protein